MSEQTLSENNQIPSSTQTPLESPINDFMSDPNVLSYIEKKVQEGILKALQGNVPKANTISLTEKEKRNFEKMTYKERLNLFSRDPHTYNKLAKGAI